MTPSPLRSRAPRPAPRAPGLRDAAIGIIGTGTMGQALLKGLLAHGVPRRRLIAADAEASARRDAAKRFRVPVQADNRTLIRRARTIILAVKPQQLAAVVEEIAPELTRRHLVISIAAGITLSWLRRRLPGVPLVRVMPNLPATVGCGFSAFAAGPGAGALARARARQLFEAVGTVVELPERHLDAVTAVSGSGPAYVFWLVEAWEAAARRLGLPASVAEPAIRATLEGSVRLLRGSGVPAAEWARRVASKGGTTEAALKTLSARGARACFIEALRAAARRSKQLSWS